MVFNQVRLRVKKDKDTDWTSGWIRIHYRMDESFGKYIQCNVKDGRENQNHTGSYD